MNKYLEKIAVVTAAKKALRRALEMGSEKSHDFHGLPTSRLQSVLADKGLNPGKNNYVINPTSESSVYTGRGAPARGFEPSTSHIPSERWSSIAFKHRPESAYVYGTPETLGKSRTTGYTDSWSMYGKRVDLSPKDYVTTHGDRKLLSKDTESLVRENRLRTLPVHAVEKAFLGKQISGLPETYHRDVFSHLLKMKTEGHISPEDIRSARAAALKQHPEFMSDIKSSLSRVINRHRGGLADARAHGDAADTLSEMTRRSRGYKNALAESHFKVDALALDHMARSNLHKKYI